MPKLKTNRGARKRFKVTGTGKVLRRRAGASHLLAGKSRKRKRRLSQCALVSGEEKRRIRRLIQK